MRRGVIAQGRGLTVVELDVVGGHSDILLAQVFAENTADFAVADEADIPLIGQHHGHLKPSPDFDRCPTKPIVSGYRPSRSPAATCRCPTSVGLIFHAACSPLPRYQVPSAAALPRRRRVFPATRR